MTAPLPPTPRGRNRAVATVVGLTAGALLVGGSVLAYQHVQRAASESGPCPVKGTHPVTMVKKDPTEPTIILPAATGWDRLQRNDVPASATELDCPLIRGIIVNPELSENAFAPNAVVTLEKFTDGGSVEEIAQAEARELQQVGTVTGAAGTRVCDKDAFRTDITGLNGGKVTSMELLTAVDGQDGVRWVAVVTLQTTNLDNPNFVVQRDALLKGLRVEITEWQP